MLLPAQIYARFLHSARNHSISEMKVCKRYCNTWWLNEYTVATICSRHYKDRNIQEWKVRKKKRRLSQTSARVGGQNMKERALLPGSIHWLFKAKEQLLLLLIPRCELIKSLSLQSYSIPFGLEGMSECTKLQSIPVNHIDTGTGNGENQAAPVFLTDWHFSLFRRTSKRRHWIF